VKSDYYETIYIFNQEPIDVKLHNKWEQNNMNNFPFTQQIQHMSLSLVRFNVPLNT